MTATHDPLCPPFNGHLPRDRCEVCDLIARVRADERKRMTLPEWAQVVADARASAEDEVRERLRAQAEALPERADAHDEDCPGRPGRRGICNCEGDILISRRAVLALLGGESE